MLIMARSPGMYSGGRDMWLSMLVVERLYMLLYPGSLSAIQIGTSEVQSSSGSKSFSKAAIEEHLSAAYPHLVPFIPFVAFK